LQRTIDLTIRSARTGGTAVIVGMAPFGVRGSFDAYDLVDRSLRVLGSNYGFSVGALDFPRYAALHLARKLPIQQLVERRIGVEDVEDAFEAMRRGEGARRVIVHGSA